MTNKGKGSFEAAGTFGVGESIGAEPRCVVLGDFNRDKKLDIASSLAGFGAVEVMLGKGDGTYDFYWGDPGSMFMVGEIPLGMSVGDLNRDQSIDLAVANYGSSNISILMNNYAPVAYKDTITTKEDVPVDITLRGTEGPLDFIIVKCPTNGEIIADTMITNENGSVSVAVNYVSIFTNRTNEVKMRYVPKPDVFIYGTDVLDYYVSDGIKTSRLARISIKILPVNDQPSFNIATNTVVVGEDAGSVKITNFVNEIIKGPTNESKQIVKFILNVPDEGALLFAGVKWTVNKANPNGAYLGYGLPQIDAKGILKFTSLKNAYGETPVRVQMMDSGGTNNGGINLSEATNFVLKITNVNDKPVIGRVLGKTILEDSETSFVVNVNDVDNAADSLTLLVTSTNKALLPDENISIEMVPGCSTQRLVKVVPVADMNGTTLLTFTVSDGVGGEASVSAVLRVTAVNDTPSFVLDEDYWNITATVGVGYTNKVITSASAGPVDESKQLLTYVIDPGYNSGLFIMQPKISANGVLTFKAKAEGEVELKVSVKDSGGVVNGAINQSGKETIKITIQPKQ